MRAAGRLGPDELRLARGRIAAGDLVLIRCNDPPTGLCNGDRCTVTAVDRRRHEATLERNGRHVVVGADLLLDHTGHGEPAVAHGYAITGHAAQGLTVDRAYVLAGPGITLEWAYTAMTRGRDANHLYLARDVDQARDEFAPSDPGSSDALTRLMVALGAERAEPLALDLVSVLPTDARLDALRRELAAVVSEHFDLTTAYRDAYAQSLALEARRAPWLPGRRAQLERARGREQTLGNRVAHLDRRERELQRALDTTDRGPAPVTTLEGAVARDQATRARDRRVELSRDLGRDMGLGR